MYVLYVLFIVQIINIIVKKLMKKKRMKASLLLPLVAADLPTLDHRLPLDISQQETSAKSPFTCLSLTNATYWWSARETFF